jgi:hypothetical protein
MTRAFVVPQLCRITVRSTSEEVAAQVLQLLRDPLGVGPA